MTIAGTPALNKPLPDHSEAEARIEKALRVARKTMSACEKVDPDKGGHAIAFALSFGMTQIITILESGK